MTPPAPAQRREAQRAPAPTIWAVASGKGGVGKSVLCASLAIGLAERGSRAVAVDLDLGGANLHTIFGCERAPHTLSDFLRGGVPLADALSDTSVRGVQLLSGARGALDIANPSYAQKQRILRSLKRIAAGDVVLDLGAGSGSHTLDAFVAADRRILIVTPEPTAIENAYHFLKAAFFRALRDVARDPAVRSALAEVLDDARRRGATPRELVEAASRVDTGAGARLRARMREFAVDLVLNRAPADHRPALPRSAHALRSGSRGDPAEQIAAAGRAELGANLRVAGALASDPAIPTSVEQRVPVMQLFPGSPFCAGVRDLVARLAGAEVIPTAPAPRAPRRTAAAQPPALPAFAPASSPGRYLRACRERLGLELSALHERTRIRHCHLASIEAERFDELPADVYLREHVRQIAEELGVPDPVRFADHYAERAQVTRSGAIAAPAAPPAPRAARVADRIPSAAELLAQLDDEPGDGEPGSAADPRPLRTVTSVDELAAYLGAGARETTRPRG